MCGPCSKGVKSDSFEFSDVVGANVRNTPCLWGLGGHKLYRNADGCSLAANGDTREFSYSCSRTTFGFADWFKDAADLWDKVPYLGTDGAQDFSGATPYLGVGQFSEPANAYGLF